MIFDRRRFYWIACGVGLVLLAVVYFVVPRIEPERRVQEQLAVVSREPWVKIRIDRVEQSGGSLPDHAVVHGVRLDTNARVQVQFIGASPYTAEAAMQYIADHALDGATADVMMLPRSVAWEPYKSQFTPQATHVGIALFAGLAESAAQSDAVPASAAGEMSVESPLQPAAAPPEPPPTPTTPPDPHG